MRRRIWYGLLALMVFAAALAAGLRPQPVEALRGHIAKIKSDCNSVELGITLVWTTSDNNQGEDRFRLYVYEREASIPAVPRFVQDEAIVRDQSPFYWVTHRINAPTFRGRYTVELWDLDKNGNPSNMVDQVHYECSLNASWRGTAESVGGIVRTLDMTGAANLAPPFANCEMYMPLYTTNQAPESGAVLVMWSGGPDREYLEYHWATIPVAAGDYFNGKDNRSYIRVPCGVYIRVYFQPDSTKLVFQMPSQYWPNSSYGTGMQDGKTLQSYHTVFPLDGPPRTDPEAPPTSTPRPVTPTPLPSATPTSEG